MTKLFLTFFICFGIYGLGFAQSSEMMYRTEEGDIYTQVEFDSIAALGVPISKIERKVVNDTAYTLIKIFRLEELYPFIAKYKGKSLPDMTLKTLDGRTITSKDLKGKVVMINFWSTTCKPCLIEIPELNRLQEKYKDRVIFLAPLPEDKNKTAKLLAKHPFKFTIAPNSSELFDKLGIDGYPKNFFINRDGVIKEVKEGTPQRKDTPDGEWYVSVYKDYSAILDEMLNSH